MKASAAYLVVMVTQFPWQPDCNINNFFVLSHIELIFGTQVS